MTYRGTLRLNALLMYFFRLLREELRTTSKGTDK